MKIPVCKFNSTKVELEEIEIFLLENMTEELYDRYRRNLIVWMY